MKVHNLLDSLSSARTSANQQKDEEKGGHLPAVADHRVTPSLRIHKLHNASVEEIERLGTTKKNVSNKLLQMIIKDDKHVRNKNSLLSSMETTSKQSNAFFSPRVQTRNSGREETVAPISTQQTDNTRAKILENRRIQVRKVIVTPSLTNARLLNRQGSAQACLNVS